MPAKRISEAKTRKEIIDPQLDKAGWYLRDHSRVKIEIPVNGYDAEPWNGVTDYTLYRENGEVLAVVKAKKTSVDVRLAEAQLTHYVTEKALTVMRNVPDAYHDRIDRCIHACRSDIKVALKNRR